MIVTFFNKMVRVLLKGIRVDSKEEHVLRIYQYIYEVNDMPVVHCRKFKMDDITV